VKRKSVTYKAIEPGRLKNVIYTKTPAETFLSIDLALYSTFTGEMQNAYFRRIETSKKELKAETIF